MAKLNPRRRRQRQRYLDHGPLSRPMQIFSSEGDYAGDMALVIRCLQMKGYHIPQEAFELAVQVPMKLAKDEEQDPKISLRAANLIRMVIKDAEEIKLMRAEAEALKADQTEQVVRIVTDKNFFDNDAHEKAKINDAENVSEGPAASDEGQSAS